MLLQNMTSTTIIFRALFFKNQTGFNVHDRMLNKEVNLGLIIKAEHSCAQRFEWVNINLPILR